MRWKVLIGVSVPLIAAAVGLHTRAGRSLLGASGCPWEKAPSAERLEEQRVKSVAALNTTSTRARATARPAFGFELDKSTRAEVTAWGTRRGASCTEELKGSALRCESLDKSLSPESGVAIHDAYFRFDPRGVLVGVDLMRDGTDGEKAAAVLETVTKRVSDAAGPPSAVQGTASPAHLGGGYLNRAASEFRFADYAADVSATNLGEQGVVVREQYRSIPN